MFLTPRFFILLAVVAFCSAMGVLWPVCYGAAQGLLVCMVLALVVDAWCLWRRAELTVQRSCKERFSNAEPNAVSIRVENLCGLPLRLTVRDELPREFRFHQAVIPMHLSAHQGQTARYELTPTQRGAYQFGRVLVYARSRVGLLERKLALGEPRTVKVYPAFQHLERYELACVSDHLQQSGNKRLRRAGNSTEFDQIKDYVPGDDYRRLNWKASARSRRWMVNVYREERAQPIWCLVDKGRTMQRTFADVTLLDYAVNAALVLSYVALRRADMPGLVTFGPTVEQTVPALHRPHQLQLLLETLYAQRTVYGETDYAALSAHLSRQLHRRSLLVLFTDFTSIPALERQLPYLRHLARQHPLLVVFFEDEEVQQLADTQPTDVNGMRLQVLASDFCLGKKRMAAILQQQGIHTLCTTPQHLSVDVVNRYLELKHRQVV